MLAVICLCAAHAESLPKLAAQAYDHFSPAPGITAERLSFATGDGLRIPAVLYHSGPVTIAAHPALLLVAAEDGDKSSWYSYYAGVLYARAGALVLTFDQIGEYERDAQKQSGVPAPTAVQVGSALETLRETDIAQAVRYLESRKDVDPKRIAILGFSTTAVTHACNSDERLAACVIAGSGTDIDSKRILALPNAGPQFLTKDAALWLEQKLKLPDWTKKEIERMPEAEIDGTMAVGQKIQPISREDLHAVPPLVWQSQQDQYTYQSWLPRVPNNAPDH